MKIKRDSKTVGIIVAVILLILTLVRIVMGVKIPLLLQGDAKYDDFMMVEYAESILSGKWLGDFSFKAMIKTAAFPMLLALGYRLGFSYAALLTILYILAVALLSFVMGKLIGNKIFAALFYIFMLFSPVMLHEENVQKIYRGGYIVVFAIFIIASVIGLFSFYKNSTAILAAFSALLSASLPIFWYLKEDSIWIMPFVICGLGCSILRCIISKKEIGQVYLRIICYVIPLLVMALSITAYRGVNKSVYGVYADTDRSGTYFQKVIEDILQIEGASNGETWVTQEALHSATLESDTLRKMAYDLDMVSYGRLEEDGEVHGDFIIWTFREAGESHGLYTSASDIEAYWEQVHAELMKAYEDGRLKRSTDKLYLSSVAVGYTWDELKEYYLGRLSEVARTVITYDHNGLTTKEASGTPEQIERMHRLVKGGYISKDISEANLESYERVVRSANRINRLYSLTGKAVFVAAFVGMLLLLYRFIVSIRRKETSDIGLILLISIGMALTAILVIVAVMWFCNFLTIWKIYDYSCGAVIIMEITEAVGVYYLVDSVISLIKKKMGNK